MPKQFFGWALLAMTSTCLSLAQDKLPSFDEDKSSAEIKQQEDSFPPGYTRSRVRTEDILPYVTLLMSNEEGFKSVELTQKQKQKLKPILDEYEKKIQGIKDKYEHVEDEAKRKRLINIECQRLQLACISAVSSELIDHQLDAFYGWLPENIGIAKALTDTPLGAGLGLSEKQRNDIRKRADALGEKMKASFQEYRDEANDLIYSALTQDQREKLMKLIDPSGNGLPQEIFKGIEISTLAHYLDYVKDEFDLAKQRHIVRGVVYDVYGNKTGEDPEKVKKQIEEMNKDIE